MDQKNTALPVNSAVRSVDQIVSGMVRVGSSQSLQKGITDVGFVVAVGVFQEQQVRAGGDNNTTAPEFKAERIVNVSENLAMVGDPVAIDVLKNHEAVVHLL